jgi:hypothetical protein
MKHRQNIRALYFWLLHYAIDCKKGILVFFRQGDLAEPFTMSLTDIEAVMGQLSGIQVSWLFTGKQTFIIN